MDLVCVYLSCFSSFTLIKRSKVKQVHFKEEKLKKLHFTTLVVLEHKLLWRLGDPLSEGLNSRVVS